MEPLRGSVLIQPLWSIIDETAPRFVNLKLFSGSIIDETAPVRFAENWLLNYYLKPGSAICLINIVHK
jgi:hypothetical protein